MLMIRLCLLTLVSFWASVLVHSGFLWVTLAFGLAASAVFLHALLS